MKRHIMHIGRKKPVVPAACRRQGISAGSLLPALVFLMILAGAAPVCALDPNALPTGGRIVSARRDRPDRHLHDRHPADRPPHRLLEHLQHRPRRLRKPSGSPDPPASLLTGSWTGPPSQIYGRLSANGQVFLVNPAGIFFSPTAQVNVGGLVASTLNITDEDFLAGNHAFARSGTAGRIVNEGTITAADGGYVAFLSPTSPTPERLRPETARVPWPPETG